MVNMNPAEHFITRRIHRDCAIAAVTARHTQTGW